MVPNGINTRGKELVDFGDENFTVDVVFSAVGTVVSCKFGQNALHFVGDGVSVRIWELSEVDGLGIMTTLACVPKLYRVTELKFEM